MRTWSLSAVVGILFLFASNSDASADSPAGAAFGTWGVETRYISKASAAGDDFYRHVNNGWLESAAIPQGFPMFGSFVHLMLETEKQLQTIVDDAKAHPGQAGSAGRQIADLFASFVDVKRRNELGAGMLADETALIMKVEDRREFARRMGRVGQASIAGVTVEPDPKHPERYLLSLKQSGLGLPREYYLLKDEPYAGTRAAFAAYIAGVLSRAGISDAAARARAVLDFQTKLAASHWTPEESRDALKTYHPMTVKQLERYAPGVDWRAMLDEMGMGDVARVDLINDSAIKRSAALFAAEPIDTLRAFFAFYYLDNRAELLSQDWVDAKFDFYGRTLSGIPAQRPLDKQALDFLQKRASEQIGKLYAARYFPAESKAAIDKLVKFLRAAFRERLQHSAWMDERTAAAAVAKLDAITIKIGYPDRWHDLSSIRIVPDDLVGNVVRIEEWQLSDARAKLKEPVRRWEWDPLNMPEVINAYYTPAGNEIVFPAAILQPPFFDPKADPAVNFGAIGMVIGHEISHGFDDQGNRYDGSGMLRDWWTDRARRGFAQRAQQLAAQYDRYSPLPGLNVNGKLTLGENIGDMGGIAIAWSGYQKLVAADYHGHAPILDGYTGDQRFFLGYAQLWRSLFAEGFLRNITLTDPHSPGEFRVNGVLRNFDPWYKTFAVSASNKLYLPPEQRVSIW